MSDVRILQVNERVRWLFDEPRNRPYGTILSGDGEYYNVDFESGPMALRVHACELVPLDPPLDVPAYACIPAPVKREG
jgi:hypothetical protein